MDLLETLTGKKWEEVDEPDSGVGLDWYYESSDGTLAAWVNQDQTWVTVKIVSLVAKQDRGQYVMPCGRVVVTQIDYYSPDLVFELQGDASEIPWLSGDHSDD